MVGHCRLLASAGTAALLSAAAFACSSEGGDVEGGGGADPGVAAAEDGAPAPRGTGADASVAPLPPAAVDFTVNGHALGAEEREILRIVARDVTPRMAGSADERLTLVARGAWWALKEGTWGQPVAAVYAYSNCNTSSGDKRIGPLAICGSGRAWQVGMAAVQVPGHTTTELEALAKKLFPESTPAALLADVVAKAGQPKNVADAIVASSGSLRTSWLLRVPALGFAAVVPSEVVPECIEGTKSWCFGTGWDETKKFAPTKAAALVAIADLRRILAALAAATAPAPADP